jgi:probable HAF family extracellular repeat protein
MKKCKEMLYRSPRIIAALVALGFAQGLLPQAAVAQRLYEAIPLPAEHGSFGAEINEAGEIVGDLWLEPTLFAYRHAFLYRKLVGSPGYDFIDLGTLGGRESYAAGMNNSGHVVGSSSTGGEGNPYHAFIYADGAMTDIDGLLGGTRSTATDINDVGHVTGQWVDAKRTARSFLYAGQIMLDDLGNLGGTDANGNPATRATSINNSGVVVGTSVASDGNEHAFLYTSAAGIVDLGTLSGSFSEAFDISNDGLITGRSATQNNRDFHAFLYDVNSGAVGMIDLGTLEGGSFSEGYGVNNKGQVVGSAMNSKRKFRAALYSDGKWWDLNELIDPSHPLPADLELRLARDINDAGWIVVDAIKVGSNVPRAYLLRPL